MELSLIAETATMYLHTSMSCSELHNVPCKKARLIIQDTCPGKRMFSEEALTQ